MHQQWASAAMSDRESIDQTIADVVLAEELGFDSFMFGEHHFPKGDFPGRIAFPEHVIAFAAARTGRIKLGTGVKVISFEKQWRVVESMLTLDLLAEGRTFYGLGAGGDEPAVFLPTVYTSEERRAAFRDAMSELLELLGSQGRSAFEDALGPVDVDSRTLLSRLWVAARDAPTIEFAARNGLHFVMGQAEVPAAQGPYIKTYRDAGGAGETRAVRIIVVAPTDEEAVRRASASYAVYADGDPLKDRYYFEAVQNGLFSAEEPTHFPDALERRGYIVGSPESVAAQLASYQEEVRADRLDLMVHLPELSPAEVRESLRLFATEVAPRLPETVTTAQPVG
ncbi:MAG: LLM class flavin-dependent oxidoreductase [Nocardioidaceae bacterium]|nr:LLM class flavin-dependent oxidoreductase [Nocardioidaceae bacterium]